MDEIQIVLALAVIYIIYKWTSRPSSSSSGSSNIDRLNALARSIPPASIEQAQSLFPHLDERSIRWQFVKTGRLNTLENVAQSLLDDSPRTRNNDNSNPPTGFWQPISPPSAPSSATTTPSASSTVERIKQAKYPSLIDRLSLQAQASEQDREILGSEGEPVDSGKGKGKDVESVGWKGLSLKEKKERFVLDARRSLLEKDKKSQTQ